jgi:hypothetical protein
VSEVEEKHSNSQDEDTRLLRQPCVGETKPSITALHVGENGGRGMVVDGNSQFGPHLLAVFIEKKGRLRRRIDLSWLTFVCVFFFTKI